MPLLGPKSLKPRLWQSWLPGGLAAGLCWVTLTSHAHSLHHPICSADPIPPPRWWQSLRATWTLTVPCFPGLAIDYPESKLYWISSGNGTINRCNLDGSNLEVIESVRSQLSKATALAIMGESWQGDGGGS